MPLGNRSGSISTTFRSPLMFAYVTTTLATIFAAMLADMHRQITPPAPDDPVNRFGLGLSFT
ncbi:hypothetical protein B0G76_4141 [Paraburkholderia sp. BL23I1N1]|nr:hypothetical protein B0G76_4141 [Paraburkholderia sp. BL23I1N1]